MSYEDKSAGNKKEFDPNDPWDTYLVERFGSIFDQDKIDELSEEEKFDNAVTFVSGRQYYHEDGEPDDFGAFSGVKGEILIEKPETEISPEQIKRHMNGQYRVQIDFAAHGQPDGPGSDGAIWIARLYDIKEKKEVPDTRIAGDKLAWVMAEVYQKMPKYGTEVIIDDEQLIIKTLESAAVSIDDSIHTIDASEKYYKKKGIAFEPRDVTKELLDLNEDFADILLSGNMKEWLHEKLLKIKEQKDPTGLGELKQKIDALFEACRANVFPYERYLTDVGLASQWKGGNPNDGYDGWLQPPDLE